MHRIFFAAAGLYLLTLYLLTLGVAAQTAPPAAASTVPPPGMAGAAKMPPGEGRDATIRVCGKCHDAGIFANQALDAEGWKQTVDEMARMADGTNDDFAAITRYLIKAFPAN
jgi:cytochrome c5